MNPREFFDRLAPEWDRMVRHDPAKLDRFIDRLALAPGDRALDVGTGTGVLLGRLLGAVGPAGDVVAVDASPAMLAEARRKHGATNLRLIAGDVLDVPLAPEAFQAIVAYSVYPHFREPEPVVARLVKALAPGGRLLVCHSQSRREINALHAQAGEAVARDLLPPAAEVASLFRRHGLATPPVVDDDARYEVLGRRPGGTPPLDRVGQPF